MSLSVQERKGQAPRLQTHTDYVSSFVNSDANDSVLTWSEEGILSMFIRQRLQFGRVESWSSGDRVNYVGKMIPQFQTCD